MDRLLEEYQAYLQFTQKKSKKTVEAYMTNLYAFSSFLKEHDLPVQKIERPDLDGFIREYALTHQSASINQMISTLRSFFSFLNLFGHRQDNPAGRLKSLQKKHHLPEYYTEREILQILDSFSLDERGIYEKLIFVLLYSCGLRVSELCSLKMNQIFLDQLFLRITGKGDKTRTVPFNPYCKALMEQYLKIRTEWMSHPSAFLLVSPKGKTPDRNAIYHLIRKINEKNGITRPLSPHSLRHSYATHLLNGHADLRIVQELLGHENIQTTQIYTHVESDRLKKAYDQAFPSPPNLDN